MCIDEKFQSQQNYLFKVYDYLTRHYIEMFQKRNIHIDITNIMVDRNLYNEMVYATLGYKDEELYRDSWNEICELSSKFFEDLEGRNDIDIVCIKGVYTAENPQVILFFMRCLWVYHYYKDTEWSKWFIIYHIVIPFFYHLKGNNNMTEEEKANIKEKEKTAFEEILLQLFADGLTNAKSYIRENGIMTVSSMIKKEAEKLREKQDEILKPVEEPLYVTNHYGGAIHDYVNERFNEYWRHMNPHSIMVEENTDDNKKLGS